MESAARLDDAAELCGALAAGLRAGLTPERCLEIAQVEEGDERLRAVAGGLVGACWDVAIESGAAPGRFLARLSEVLSSSAHSLRQAEVAASGPRATIRLVMMLPIASLLLAQIAGIPAVTELVATVWGWCLAIIGVALLWISRRWMNRLVRRAQRMSWACGLAPELVAMVLRSGGSPTAAWQLVDALPHEGYRTVEARTEDAQICRRAIEQADEWGIPVAALLELQASLQRRTQQQEREVQMATLGVRVMLPLGMCVLPAFVLLAVIPTVLALLSSTGLSRM